MTHLAFDKNSKVVFASSTKLEVSVPGSTITWATLDGEYNDLYAYTHSDGVATKGDLLPVDEDEEKRKDDEWKAIKYKYDRKPKYPDIGDQLDDLYKKGAFSTEMAAKIKAVKDEYPKSESA